MRTTMSDEQFMALSPLDKRTFGELLVENRALKEKLGVAMVLLEKLAIKTDCDAVYADECSACDLENFIRIVKEQSEVPSEFNETFKKNFKKILA
jgi:hypothetical protein